MNYWNQFTRDEINDMHGVQDDDDDICLNQDDDDIDLKDYSACCSGCDSCLT